eukprot:m.140158 g.140158  ORF g.140158 m.140158 type:complete len:430 (+) comp38293_c0_seq1:151-1440(+)
MEETEATSSAVGVRRLAARKWLELTILAVAVTLSFSNWFSASVVMAQFKDRFDTDNAGASWLSTTVLLGFITGALTSAVVAAPDRIASPRYLVVFGSFASAVFNAFLLLNGTYGAALTLRFLTGAAYAFVYGPAVKAVAAWFTRNRGLAVGVMVGALTLGSALPSLVAALAGSDPEWRVVVAATSVLSLIAGFVVMIGSDGPFVPESTSGRFDIRHVPKLFKNRRLVLTYLGYVGHNWELYALWSWFNTFYNDYLNDKGHQDAAFHADQKASFVSFGVIGIGCIASCVGGLLGDRFGRTKVILVHLIISGICAFSIGHFRSLPQSAMILISLVWGYTAVADSAQYSTLATELCEQTYIGTAVTVQLALGYVASAASVLAMPALHEHYSWTWAFSFLSLGPLLGVPSIGFLHFLLKKSARESKILEVQSA